MPISVFLLDDHEIVRRGIAQLLEGEDDIKVVGEAGSAAQALARLPALRPDVAILDVRLPDGDGIAVCRDVRSAVEPPPACLIPYGRIDPARRPARRWRHRGGCSASLARDPPQASRRSTYRHRRGRTDPPQGWDPPQARDFHPR